MQLRIETHLVLYAIWQHALCMWDCKYITFIINNHVLYDGAALLDVLLFEDSSVSAAQLNMFASAHFGFNLFVRLACRRWSQVFRHIVRFYYTCAEVRNETRLLLLRNFFSCAY